MKYIIGGIIMKIKICKDVLGCYSTHINNNDIISSFLKNSNYYDKMTEYRQFIRNNCVNGSYNSYFDFCEKHECKETNIIYSIEELITNNYFY
jgi:hypothetical protein